MCDWKCDEYSSPNFYVNGRPRTGSLALAKYSLARRAYYHLHLSNLSLILKFLSNNWAGVSRHQTCPIFILLITFSWCIWASTTLFRYCWNSFGTNHPYLIQFWNCYVHEETRIEPRRETNKIVYANHVFSMRSGVIRSERMNSIAASIEQKIATNRTVR